MKLINLLKKNVIFLYSTVIFIVVLIISAVLSISIISQNTEHIINRHVEMYPYIVKNIFKHHNYVKNKILQSEVFEDDDKNIRCFEENIMEIDGVITAEIMDTNGTILWSNNKALINNVNGNKDLFEKALSGEIVYEYHNDRFFNNPINNNGVLEIYLPIYSDNEIIGVTIISESTIHLMKEIRVNNELIIIQIFIAGFTLFVLLFFVFYKSYKTIKEKSIHIQQTQDATIFALGYLAELKDVETGKHLERTSSYVDIIIDELIKNNKYNDIMTNEYITDMKKGSVLHDIGKVFVPDNILLKPGILTKTEFDIIKKHTIVGAEILEKAQHKLSYPSFFNTAIEMIMGHHEKWDGTGYPIGISQEQIPLSARIMALADTYDALRSKRSYKESFSRDKCIKIITEEKGLQFDPDIVEAFIEREKDFYKISIDLDDN